MSEHLSSRFHIIYWVRLLPLEPHVLRNFEKYLLANGWLFDQSILAWLKPRCPAEHAENPESLTMSNDSLTFPPRSRDDRR
jgi:hypothetical protein